MAKTVDVPKELREFNYKFDALSQTFNYYDVFNDIMEYWIAYFSRGKKRRAKK